jgi:hypothetical protein
MHTTIDTLTFRLESVEKKLSKTRRKEGGASTYKQQGSCMEIEYLLQKYYQTERDL